MSATWHVIVPLKPAALGKSRLGVAEGVVRALGISTVAAAVACSQVAEVVVVTSDPETAEAVARMPRVRVVRELAPRGLRLAIASALATVAPGSRRAVLLGDLPGLMPADLARALVAASRHPRSFVADAARTGSTLVTARGGVRWRAAFGSGSASRHRALGLFELPVPLRSSLRHDVDTPAQLAKVLSRGRDLSRVTNPSRRG